MTEQEARELLRNMTEEQKIKLLQLLQAMKAER